MKIGKINDLFPGLCCRLISKENAPLAEGGDPLKGEPLIIKRESLRSLVQELQIQLPEPIFLDRLVLRFGEKTRLKQITLLDEGALAHHIAETGAVISSREITLEAAAPCKALTLRIEADYSDIIIEEIALFGAIEDGLDLFPTPAHCSHSGKRFPVAAYQTYSSRSPKSQKAEAVLAEKLLEEAAIRLLKAEEGAILFEEDPALCANGFTLSITEKAVRLAAADERGFVMAAETLIKLLEEGTLPACEIKERPCQPFRGVHLFLPGKEDLELTKRMVKYLFSPLGYNAIILQVSAGMKFDSHPLINQKTEEAIEKANQGIRPPFPHAGVAAGKALEKEAVRELVAYIRSFGIEVIPEIQSLGHVQYMTTAYPEIAEIPVEASEDWKDTQNRDARPKAFYQHCYCPSQERSYEILFDLMEEIIEVFEPKEYVHMGHDEIYELGVCELCRKKDPAELLAADLNRIHAFLKKKSLRMMIWADMLQKGTKYGTASAIEQIPKDIVLLDFIWYFHLDRDIEDHLLEHGFKVAIGNLYSSHYPRYCSRSRKAGMIGGQISAWVQTDIKSLAQEGKFYDFFLTAQMLAAESYSPCYTHIYDQMISKQMPALREKLEGISFPSRRKGAKRQLLLEQPFTDAPLKEIAVDARAASAILCHTMLKKLTKHPWLTGAIIGEYVFTYEDGSEERYPLQVGKNIAHWNRRQHEPNRNSYYRHTGYMTVYYCEGIHSKTEEGENVCLYQVEVPLDPSKPLRSIRLEERSGAEAGIALCKAEIVKG